MMVWMGSGPLRRYVGQRCIVQYRRMRMWMVRVCKLSMLRHRTSRLQWILCGIKFYSKFGGEKGFFRIPFMQKLDENHRNLLDKDNVLDSVHV